MKNTLPNHTRGDCKEGRKQPQRGGEGRRGSGKVNRVPSTTTTTTTHTHTHTHRGTEAKERGMPHQPTTLPLPFHARGETHITESNHPHRHHHPIGEKRNGGGEGRSKVGGYSVAKKVEREQGASEQGRKEGGSCWSARPADQQSSRKRGSPAAT